MKQMTLGRTGLVVNKDGFGALPVQRRGMDDAVALLRQAADAGIDFFDTARAYSDSEEKLGRALAGRRQALVLATKTTATTVEGFWQDLQTSLANLRTEYVDVYQLHNAQQCYRPGDGTGLYEAMQEARQKGMIRFIGITAHKLPVAQQAVESGLYDTLQFPFSYLSGAPEEALVRRCQEKNIGFIAMKALSGGLITDVAAARAWHNQYPGSLPIWGIQKTEELNALLAAMAAGDAPPTAQQAQRIAADRQELAGDFCRGCGYCMPCPVDINISWCARMSLLLRRAPAAEYLEEKWQGEMAKIDGCLHCGQCSARCPYGLDTSALLAKNLKDYRSFLA